jgi:hypothetical protein
MVPLVQEARRFVTAAIAFAALCFAPGLAAADEGLDVRSEPPPKLAPGSVKLFSTQSSTYALVLAGGPISYRSVHDAAFESGVFEARLGRTITTPKYPFFLAGYRYIDVRMFDTKSYALSLLHEIGGGVALGPLEPEVRFGFHLVDLDVFRGNYNASLLSPRVSVGAAIKLAKFRLDVLGYSEYLWRWFGPSYLTRGLVIGLSLDTPRPRERSFTESDGTVLPTPAAEIPAGRP